MQRMKLLNHVEEDRLEGVEEGEEKKEKSETYVEKLIGKIGLFVFTCRVIHVNGFF